MAALVGGFCFILPGLVVILGLSAVFLATHPPGWIGAAAAGADAAVPAVALAAAAGLLPASWRRAARSRPARGRWTGYLGRPGGDRRPLAGPGPAACGFAGSPGARRPGRPPRAPQPGHPIRAAGDGEPGPGPATGSRVRCSRPAGPRGAAAAGGRRVVAAGGLLAVAWVALKVGALSYGGGFVIIPLMQHDAVHTYHWMTSAQFLSAVALGQVTPGPVVQTVAVVGYAAAGVAGGLLAALVAFSPSFLFVLGGARISTGSGPTTPSRPSSPGPGRPPSAPSPEPPSRSGWPWPTCGSWPSWCSLRSGWSACAAGWSAPSPAPRSSA